MIYCKNNFGEVFYTISFAALAITFWTLDRLLAGTIMLFMSIGDSVTGIVRSRFVKERRKHWTGSLAMLLSCLLIGMIFFGVKGAIMAMVATLAEYQPFIDDNLAIPLITAIASIL